MYNQKSWIVLTSVLSIFLLCSAAQAIPDFPGGLNVSSGNVGIGTNNPQSRLFIKGKAYFDGSNTYTNYSWAGGELQTNSVEILDRVGGSTGDGIYPTLTFHDYGNGGAQFSMEGSTSILHLGSGQSNSAGTLAGAGQYFSKLKIWGGLDTTGYIKSKTGYVDRNLMDANNWTLGSGSIGDFGENGSDAENQRVWDVNPYGQPSIVWKSVNDAPSNDDGGWNYNNIPVDPNKAYRVSVWVKKDNTSSGVVYLGCYGGNTLNLSGTPDGNPYFLSFGSGNLVAGRWYLLVGYIHANNDSSTISYSAVYDGLTGKKILTGTDWKNNTGTTQTQRVYNYYDTNAGSIQWFWGPRFEEINGNEPSIEALLGNPQGATRNSTAYFGGSVGVGTISPNDTFSIGSSGNAAPAGSTGTGHNYTSTYLSSDKYALANYGLVETLVANAGNSLWQAKGSWLAGSLSDATRLIGITSPDGGSNFALAYKNGQMYPYTDGWFYQNEGQYRVLDTSDLSSMGVAWGNITGRPDWLNGGSYIAGTPTSNMNDWLNSGFYQNYAGTNNPTGTWFNFINVRHSNQGNYHGFQMGMSYYDNNLWYRSYQGSGTFQPWVYAINSGNIGSQTVANATNATTAVNSDTVDGVHATSFFQYAGFTLDANWMGANRSGFTYSVGAPWTGPVVRFDSSNYDLELNGNYGDGTAIGYRIKNGDNNNWNSWYRLYSDTYHPLADKVSGIASNPDNSHPGTGLRPFYSWNTGQAKNASAGYSNGISIGSHPGDQSYGFQIVQNMWDDNLYFRRYNAGWQGWYTVVAQNSNGDASVSNNLAVTNNIVSKNLYPGVTQQNLDLIKNPGLYEYDGGITGTSPNGSPNYRTIEIGAGGRYSQIALPWNSDNMYFRRNTDGSWSGWRTVVSADSAGNSTIGGTMTATGFIYNSDVKLKKNINTIDNALAKILQLRGVSFNWKKDNSPSVGLIAQEVETVFPELVSESNGIKSVQYGNLVAPLIEAVKEQQKEIESLNGRIKILEAQK